MKYPCLIPKQFCKTEIKIEIDREGLDKYGEPLETVKWSGMCSYQDKGRTVLTADKKLIQLSGTALIPGDIAPELPIIPGGTISVFGEERTIYQGTKARNADGSVNYTKIEVI